MDHGRARKAASLSQGKPVPWSTWYKTTLGSLCHHTGWKKIKKMKKLGGCLSLHSNSLKSPWGDRLSQPWRTAWHKTWTLSTRGHLLTCQYPGAYSANMVLKYQLFLLPEGDRRLWGSHFAYRDTGGVRSGVPYPDVLSALAILRHWRRAPWSIRLRSGPACPKLRAVPLN